MSLATSIFTGLLKINHKLPARRKTAAATGTPQSTRKETVLTLPALTGPGADSSGGFGTATSFEGLRTRGLFFLTLSPLGALVRGVFLATCWKAEAFGTSSEIGCASYRPVGLNTSTTTFKPLRKCLIRDVEDTESAIVVEVLEICALAPLTFATLFLFKGATTILAGL